MKYILLFLFSLPVYAGTLTGTVSGLATGKSVTILSGSNVLTILTTGSYSITDGGPISIAIQPIGQVCTVSVTNIACQNIYTVGGTISGLYASGLVLKLNSTNTIIAKNATTFKFSTSLPRRTSYAVTVGIQPVGLVCLVFNGTGTIGTSNVTNVSVNCQTTYTVGGTISGLMASGLILSLNSSSKIIPLGATSFRFSTNLTTGTAYNVAAIAQPSSQTCLVSNGTGTIVASNIDNVAVICSVNGIVTLTWSKPTQNTDGSLLTDLAGYKLYYGISADSLPNVIDIPNANTLSYIVQGLNSGTLYYFRISSYNAQNLEGPWSNPASGNAG